MLPEAGYDSRPRWGRVVGRSGAGPGVVPLSEAVPPRPLTRPRCPPPQLRRKVSSGLIEDDTVEALMAMLATRFPSVLGEQHRRARRRVTATTRHHLPRTEWQ